MITRIRIVGIEPGTIKQYMAIARDWKNLLHKHGGKVLGFYWDEKNNKVTGIAEYESREKLAEIQKKCESEGKYCIIVDRTKELITSFEETILDKLDID